MSILNHLSVIILTLEARMLTAGSLWSSTWPENDASSLRHLDLSIILTQYIVLAVVSKVHIEYSCATHGSMLFSWLSLQILPAIFFNADFNGV